jgi:hypothetical protein
VTLLSPQAPDALRQALRGYHRDSLRRIANAQGVAWEGLQKEQLVVALAEYLGREEVIDAALARLHPLERGVLNAIAALAGYATTEPLRAHLIACGMLSPVALVSLPEQLAGLSPERACDAVLTRLTHLGLVFAESQGGPPPPRDLSPGEHLLVPGVILARLGRVEEAAPASFEEPPAGAVSIPGAEEALLRDCYFYWSGVRDTPPLLTSRGFVAKRDLLRLAGSLAVAESLDGVMAEDRAGRIYFLRCLLQTLGLLRQEGNSLRARETDLFHQPPAERARRLFTTWRDGTWWNELARIEEVKITVHHAYQRRVMQQIGQGRRFLLALLQALPAGRWYQFSGFGERVQMAKADFLLGRQRPPFWAAGTADDLVYSLQWQGVANDWATIEGGFVRAVIAGPLHWMGCCDLALRGGELLAFRLTSLGRWLLEAGEGAPIEEPAAFTRGDDGRVIVQPNFDILVYEPVSPHVLADLDRFATRQGTGNVLQYHLSRASLYRAQLQGLGAEGVIAVLERAAGRELPQNVRYSLLDWQRQHERITFYDGMALCQVADPAILDALLASSRGRETGARRLAPDVALVPAGALETVRHLLKESGYLSSISDGGVAARGSLLSPRLYVASDGTIRVQAPLVSLPIRGALDRFAEPRGDGSPMHGRAYALTPASIRAAVGAGLTVPAILTWLEGHADAPLPPALVDRLKSWSGHYGTVSLSRPILVRLESAELLAELLADAQVGPLLHPLVASSGLATTAEEDLPGLREALAAKGIVLDDQT